MPTTYSTNSTFTWHNSDGSWQAVKMAQPTAPPPEHSDTRRYWARMESDYPHREKPMRLCACAECVGAQVRAEAAIAIRTTEAAVLAAKKRKSVAKRGRGWGVEIECIVPSKFCDDDSGDYSALIAALKKQRILRMSKWCVHDDGSLGTNGDNFTTVELSSPILYGEEGIAEMRAMMDALRKLGGKVNKTCGMHIHVGVEDLSLAERKRITTAFVRYEPFFDALVPLSRRNHSACQSNRAFAKGGTLPAKLDTLRKPVASQRELEARFPAFEAKYLKLNVSSASHRGTFEFRQHSGTLNSNKAENWVRLVLGFVESFRKPVFVAKSKREDFNAFLKALNLPKQTVRSLQKRRRDLVGREDE